MTENHQSDLDDPATWPLIEGEDEPIGYDGFGAPLYPWQQPDPLPARDPRSVTELVDEAVRRMTIPTVELPEIFTRWPYPLPFEEKHSIAEAFQAQHDINQVHKKLEHDPWHGWEEVGYLSSDGGLQDVRDALSALAAYQVAPARQIWITGLPEPEDDFLKGIIEERARTIVRAEDDAIRHRLTTWAWPKIEMTFDLEEVDFDVLNLLIGYDIRPPFCEQQIPARGQE